MIAFLSDFGLKDPYAGIVKGVITSIAPDCRIIDLTHQIPFGDVHYAAFVLDISYKHFPIGTIFLCVVDPGVGSDRMGIIGVSKKGYYFVGPDNGLFSYIEKREKLCFYKIENPSFFISNNKADISSSFHGRDIFAPVCAHLYRGVSPSEIGPRLDDRGHITLELPSVKSHKYNIKGNIVYFDGFGNAITNIENDLIKKAFGSMPITIKVNDKKLPLIKFYKKGADKGAFGIIGSHGLLEISVYMDSAKDYLGLFLGDNIELEPSK